MSKTTRNRFRARLVAIAALALTLVCAGGMLTLDYQTAAAQDDQVAETTVDVTELDPAAIASALTGSPVLAYIGVAGVVLSFAQSIFTKSAWSKEAKMMIGAALYVVAGAGYWVVEKWQSTEAVLTIMGIASVALVWYRLNHSGMDDLRDRVGLK